MSNLYTEDGSDIRMYVLSKSKLLSLEEIGRVMGVENEDGTIKPLSRQHVWTIINRISDTVDAEEKTT